jgi:hypothetical protein
MKVELTEEMILAINVALNEFDNGSDWSHCFDDEDEFEKVERGIEQLRKLI